MSIDDDGEMPVELVAEHMYIIEHGGDGDIDSRTERLRSARGQGMTAALRARFAQWRARIAAAVESGTKPTKRGGRTVSVARRDLDKESFSDLVAVFDTLLRWASEH
jgi:hypothetical protein